MASMSDHLNKVREQRIAREKARIDKLRELNLKKYSKTELQETPKPAPSTSFSKPDIKRTQSTIPKYNHQADASIRPITAPAPKVTAKHSMTNLNIVSAKSSNYKLNNTTKTEKSHVVRRPEVRPWNFNVPPEKKPVENGVKNIGDASKLDRRTTTGDNFRKPIGGAKSNPNMTRNDKGDVAMTNVKPGVVKNDPKLPRKSFIPKFEPKPVNAKPKQDFRKSFQPKLSKSTSEVNPNRQSVFERLYQPKPRFQKTNITDSEKLQNDPNFLKKVMLNSAMILSKRHTVFETERAEKVPRRSISAVHFRRMSKNELSNCIHKWSSIGEKLDKAHLKDVSEDAAVKEDKIVSAVKSEKKVKFQTPVYNFNTPKPEELRSRLQKWLQKRGKSIDSYHHLQCFGIHHLAEKEIRPLNLGTTKFDELDDEDKENKPVESDSDDDSYQDIMNNTEDDNTITDILKKNGTGNEAPSTTDNCVGNEVVNDKWRRASIMSDCVMDMNDTQESMLTTVETPHLDELLLGALNDLTELLREGFDWEQCARWLRAVRERFPSAPHTAAYWECRAALEERRGDLPASVQCWEEAIAKGTERTVVEANLDQLLDKFMQLRISPRGGRRRQPDPKLVDVKNVFKSTLIRFAVQQAKLRQSQESKLTVTPVRRSGRLSAHAQWSARRTPLQECTSVQQAGLLAQQPLKFVPNDKLVDTP